MKKIIWGIITTFLILLIWRSFLTMVKVPLHDFDEANRAETARNMDIYRSYFAPLNGSPFEQEKEYEKAKNNPLLKVHYHLERPPFYYLTMILSSRILGDNEFAYRLPSMIFGLSTLIIFAVVTFPMTIPVLTFITSTDWWLSSQSALMDTSLALFLFTSFVMLMLFAERKKAWQVILSGIFLGLAILSKGQPAVIIAFPLTYLLIIKKMSFKDIGLMLFSAAVIIAPWVVVNSGKFGVFSFLGTFLGFAKKRSTVADATQLAPFYWYARWWIESFRIGWLLFISLVIRDFKNNDLSFRRSLILAYFIPSFILFSISKNKVWWYVLPLIPVVCLYIHESVTSILKKDRNKLLNLSLATFLLNLPLFYEASNKVALAYAFLILGLAYHILNLKIKVNAKFFNVFYVLTAVVTLSVFCLRFPVIDPTYKETKPMGVYYQNLKQPKCLYIQSMPYEAMLFYSKAEEIKYFDKKPTISKKCNNYLVSPDAVSGLNSVHDIGGLKLYKIN